MRRWNKVCNVLMQLVNSLFHSTHGGKHYGPFAFSGILVEVMAYAQIPLIRFFVDLLYNSFYKPNR